ncbi:MAG: class I SAM-dependent methyltransferase [Cyanobacteria bacterium J06592_8]
MENLIQPNVYSVSFFWPLPELKYGCPICGYSEKFFASPYPSKNENFSKSIVVFCGHCGSGFVYNADQLISGYYQKKYAETNRKDRNIEPSVYFSTDSRSKYPKLGRYFSRSQAQVRALTKYGSKFDYVLDYGSGPGYFLYLSEAKYKFAVELDEESDKYLTFLGAQKLDPEKLPEKFFDAIVASHSIEHLTPEELNDRLIQIANALKPGGMLLIEVPQGGHSYLALTTRQDPHTIFFTPQGIYEAVCRTGVKILSTYARGKTEEKLNPNAVYQPPENNEFFCTRSGGLTLVCRRDD